MISLLVPTRARPDSLHRFVASALEMANAPEAVEVVAYIDRDDDSYDGRIPPHTKALHGPRCVLSDTWNRCFAYAQGDIVAACGDDVVFRSPGWDTAVLAAFARIPDRIAYVHGRDGHHDSDFGPHGFLHRRWVDVLGYVVPPWYTADYSDTWVNDVSDAIRRRVYLPDVFMEHLHPSWGTAEIDTTHEERLARMAEQRPDLLYASPEHQALRAADVAKLRALIREAA